MMSYWTNFAKHADPNGEGLSEWPTFTDQSPKAMLLDVSSIAATLPNLDKIKAFDKYYAWRRDEARQKAQQQSAAQ